jgi:hypothetical protein
MRTHDNAGDHIVSVSGRANSGSAPFTKSLHLAPSSTAHANLPWTQQDYARHANEDVVIVPNQLSEHVVVITDTADTSHLSSVQNSLRD